MKVETNQVDELNAKLTLTIEKDDYIKEFNDQIKSYKSKAHLKGFRKGKTPTSVIRKMYGASVMQESVSKILSEKLNEIITGDEFDIIGEPFLVDRENLPEIDHNNPTDYTYNFELGLEPKFEILGIGESDSYPKYEVEITDDMVNEEVNTMLKKLGEQKSVDGPVEEGDVIYFKASELEEGNIKVEGRIAEFSTSYDKVNPSYIAQLGSASKGSTLNVNIYDFETDLDREAVDKYILKLEENTDSENIGEQFQLEVIDIVRVQEAEKTQETWDKAFGKDEIKSEDEVKEKISGYLNEYFSSEGDKLVNREIMQSMMEVNEIALPEEFLKKWLDTDKEPMTEEQFESFKKELKWRIIKKKLVKKYEVEVKEEEIFQHFVNAIKNYSPYIDEGSLKKTAFSLMQNREQVNTAVETISSGKVFDKLKKDVSLNPEKVSKDKFYEIVKNLNQKAQ